MSAFIYCFDNSKVSVFRDELIFFVFARRVFEHLSETRLESRDTRRMVTSLPFGRAIMQVLCAAMEPHEESASNKFLWHAE